MRNYKYMGTNIDVEFPLEYQAKEKEFRGVWVTPHIGDFKLSDNKEEMIKTLSGVINKMKEYNLNAIIFHVRYINNALYKTKMAPIQKECGTYETFEKWDYLKWFIEECHKNNIEFHAWLNPYRIQGSGFDDSITKEDIVNMYKDYPLNPANDPENILLTHPSKGTRGAILDPAKDVVQQHIIDVCKELMENYDIDAIHFDDYFYAIFTENHDTLNEEDQDDYIAYIEKHKDCGYRVDSVEDKKDWRRENVNKFIHDLHLVIKEYNLKNNKAVQFGVSPTGIYKNGDGSVESGSNTKGQEHYASYLFCDSLKWVKEGWIDYIIPQSYWGFGHPIAGYADVSDWWNKAVEGTGVNLYMGMGIYMTGNPNSYSWAEKGNYEASDQVLYQCKLKNVLGSCIFAYRSIFALEKETNPGYNGFKKLKEEYWKDFVLAPDTKAKNK